MKNKKNMIIRMSEELLSEYKTLCEENGYSMSKRIRKYIISEIKEMKYEKTNN